MTNVNGISFGCCEEHKSNKRILRHAGNALATGTGLAATGLLLSQGYRLADDFCTAAITASNGTPMPAGWIGKGCTKVYNVFAKAGERLFGDNTAIGKAIKRYVTGQTPTGKYMFVPEQIAAVVKKYKTVGAMGLAAGIVSLALIARALYKAGKIDAK